MVIVFKVKRHKEMDPRLLWLLTDSLSLLKTNFKEIENEIQWICIFFFLKDLEVIKIRFRNKDNERFG